MAERGPDQIVYLEAARLSAKGLTMAGLTPEQLAASPRGLTQPAFDDIGPRKEGTISVAGQPVLPKKERSWTITLEGMKNFNIQATAFCPCGFSWETSRERQWDAFVPCPKCGSRM